MADLADLGIYLLHPLSEWRGGGGAGMGTDMFTKPVGEAQEHRPQSHVAADDISDVLTVYYPTDEDGSLFSTGS